MKIAFIPATYFPYIGGAEVQTHNVANKLEEFGIEVDVFVLNNFKNVKFNYNLVKLNKFLINFIFIFHYYLNIDIRFFLKPYFKNIIKKKKYTCWHFHSLNYKTLLYVDILKQLNQKIFITFQGADIQVKKNINYGYRLNKKYDLLLRKDIKKIDKFLSISQEIDLELKKLKISKKKILYLPNSVEINKFKKFFKKNKKSKIITLITVARNSEKKKGYDLISKIYPLLEKEINFRWFVIGKNTSLLKEKKELKHFKNIKFVEEIKNTNEIYFPNSKLIKLYSISDLYINLSRIESFGITFIEAMSANLPIVSFNTPGGRLLIKNNLNGYLIDVGNYIKFAKKIINYKFNLNCKKFNNSYLKDFDLKQNALSLLKMYSSK